MWADGYRLAVPASRVLAECDAKRRIVEQFVRGDTDDLWADEIGALLALPYADHPDYREEWRPFSDTR